MNTIKTAVVVLSHFYGGHGFSDRQLRRMNKALEVFNTQKADYLITTGGFGFFNRSELSLGERSRDYFLTKGVNEKALLFEGKSTTTKENLAEIVPLLVANKIQKVVIVTSVDHMLRVKFLAPKILPPTLEISYVVSDYHSTLKVTVWDFFWHLGGWIKIGLGI